MCDIEYTEKQYDDLLKAFEDMYPKSNLSFKQKLNEIILTSNPNKDNFYNKMSENKKTYKIDKPRDLGITEGFLREYQAEFICSPTDEIWLDKKEHSKHVKFSHIELDCTVCMKTCKIMFRETSRPNLSVRIRGHLCPNCKRGGFMYYD